MRLRTLATVSLFCLSTCALWGQRPAAAKPAAAAAACQTTDNANYAAQIKHNTTLPNFTNEFIDHLPLNSCVPSPDAYFGHIIGAPNILDYTDKLNGYLRLLESKSKRIKVFSMGKSEEGREMLVAAISDEETIAALDHYKQITRQLADPRTLSEAQAKTLIAQGKPMYWATGSIHSTEPGSPEMLMELAYRLIAEESPMIQQIRKSEIVMITPLIETDGHDREVDVVMHRENHPTEATPPLLWWGHYVEHDNNRDGMTLALALSRNTMATFLDWHPTVLHDLHESEPFLYISTGGGPYNPWLDPMQIDEWHQMAYNEIDEMTKRGMIGVWSHTYYDGWAPNYLFYFANTHNAIGRFYETQSAPGGAGTGAVMVGASNTSREWYRPNPPLPSVIWSLRDNVNYQETGLLLAMSYTAEHAQAMLHDFYLKGQRSVAKARVEGPAAWVFPGDDPRTFQQAHLLDELQMQGVEVHKADADFTANGKKYPAGSYIVRMDQPYSRLVDMLLDTQYYSPNDPRPYDDTGWTLGALADTATVRVRDVAILDVPMTKLTAPATPPGGVSGSGTTLAINNNADANLATFRYKLAGTAMSAAEQEFTADGHHFNAGSVLIANADVAQVQAAAQAAHVQAVALTAAPTVATHPLAAARIALVHNWQSTQNDGWYRVALDQMQVPFTYLADTTIRVTPNLREQFDVILLPTTIGGDLPAIIHGVGGAAPIAWKNTPDMPNLVAPGIDSTDDIRGGMGITGINAIEEFVAHGGLLITVGGNATLPIELGMASGVTARTPPETLIAGGGVVRATVEDNTSPVSYGYSHELDVYYSSMPILSAGGAGGGRGGGGRGGRGGGAGGGRGGATRTSGTGDLETPDVIQARPYDLQQAARGGAGSAPGGLDLGATPMPAGAGRGGRGAGGGGGGRGRGGAVGAAPRVIVRFADAENLPISGLLQGGEAIAGQAAVVQSKYGDGYVVMFGANPMWRNETSGEYALIMNAAMNFSHLDAGGTAAAAPGRGGPAGGNR